MSPPPPSSALLSMLKQTGVLTAAAVLWQSATEAWTLLTTHDCEQCRATGLVTCPACGGWKSRKHRPGTFRLRDMEVVSSPRHSHACPHCGPPTTSDQLAEAEGSTTDALRIYGQLQRAAANVLPLHDDLAEPAAGTVQCPACGGDGHVRQLGRLNVLRLGLSGPWNARIACADEDDTPGLGEAAASTAPASMRAHPGVYGRSELRPLGSLHAEPGCYSLPGGRSRRFLEYPRSVDAWAELEEEWPRDVAVDEMPEPLPGEPVFPVVESPISIRTFAQYPDYDMFELPTLQDIEPPRPSQRRYRRKFGEP
ncbi:hypothetical protein H632_c44p3 [Helicosporidium sp. ATCC 50920]|nr:hypothetical protein H632_c44p3 [Helicosporidium sp. ATCC 50920]|eukprot:KDD77001.1 hypothetical protein H632_c44p3 [Helicosporidium sp. ATCC 50920]